MTKRIFKYQLEIDDSQSLLLPKGAEILTVQAQDNNPMLWALVNPDEETEERNFETFGTGHPVGYDMGVERTYIGTYHVKGDYVFHVFERVN